MLSVKFPLPVERGLPMKIVTKSFTIKSKGFTDIHDVTPRIDGLIRESGLHEGSALLFVPGATAGLSTIEYEPGAVRDLKEAIDRLAPQNMHYHHDARWGDGNGFSHVRAALMKPNLEVPVLDGKLLLGTWQQIILLDFDNGPRSRMLVCQLRGNFTDLPD
jgi:secondary thiamine-phosphate synthase enzyme